MVEPVGNPDRFGGGVRFTGIFRKNVHATLAEYREFWEIDKAFFTPQKPTGEGVWQFQKSRQKKISKTSIGKGFEDNIGHLAKTISNGENS